MSLAHPWVLLLLPVAWYLLRKWRPAPPVTVASVDAWSPLQGGRQRWLWLPDTLSRLAVYAMIVALAQPRGGSNEDIEVTQGVAIELLVDVSSSMDMTTTGIDGEPSTRMEVARTTVERFIAGDGDRLGGRPDDLIGLITFARYADTRSPLTFGHDALLQIVRNLEVQNRPNEDGTAYGDAIALAAARLKNLAELKHPGRGTQIDDIASRVIILLTDGENNSGSHLPLEAAGMAKQWDCRIYAISLGEPDAAAGGTQLSAAEEVLERIATETGGLFRRATDYESLLGIYAEIDRLERSEIATETITLVSEWLGFPLAAAVGLLLASLLLEATWFRIAP